MIIIIRALPKKGQKRERPKKEKKEKKKKKKINKGKCYYLFFHTCASKQHLVLHVVSLIYCASKQHHVFHIVSLISCLFHTSGNFSLQNLACIFLRWASSNALGLHEQASWMHTHQFSFVEHSQLQCIRCMAIPTPHVDIN